MPEETTPSAVLPMEIQRLVLNQLNTSTIKSTAPVLRPSMLIDEPKAVYDKLLSEAYRPNKFDNINNLRGIVLLKFRVDSTQPLYSRLMSAVFPGRLSPQDSISELVGFICEVPELVCKASPMHFLTNRDEYFRRALKYPFYHLDSTAVVSPELLKAQVGSVVEIQYDDSNLTTGNITKLVTPGNLDEYVYNGISPQTPQASFEAGDVVNPRPDKTVSAAERTGLPETEVLAAVNSLVPGGYITSNYGPRNPPKSGASSDHKGVDIGLGQGAPITAPRAGTVTSTSSGGSGGNILKISHTDGTETRYMHLASFQVKKGAEVQKGDVVGLVGSTGNVTGPHLHFEVKRGGTAEDPVLWLSGQG